MTIISDILWSVPYQSRDWFFFKLSPCRTCSVWSLMINLLHHHRKHIHMAHPAPKSFWTTTPAPSVIHCPQYNHPWGTFPHKTTQTLTHHVTNPVFFYRSLKSLFGQLSSGFSLNWKIIFWATKNFSVWKCSGNVISAVSTSDFKSYLSR